MNLDQDLIVLTSDIAAKYCEGNTIRADDVPKLITGIHGALKSLVEPPPALPAKQEPAVSAKASVKPDRVTCMECGFTGKMLKRHLKAEHALEPGEYRAKWGLSDKHPLVAPDYAAVRKELAVKIGLGRKAGRA
jgi:predicted transcriptional regulator